jgi:cathepsin E
MFPTTLLTALLLAISVAANPIVQVRHSPVNLPLSRHVNTTSVHNLVRHDVNRAKALKARGKALAGGKLTFEEAATVNQPVDNQAVTYIASVGVGSPATTCASPHLQWILQYVC